MQKLQSLGLKRLEITDEKYNNVKDDLVEEVISHEKLK